MLHTAKKKQLQKIPQIFQNLAGSFKINYLSLYLVPLLPARTQLWLCCQPLAGFKWVGWVVAGTLQGMENTLLSAARESEWGARTGFGWFCCSCTRSLICVRVWRKRLEENKMWKIEEKKKQSARRKTAGFTRSHLDVLRVEAELEELFLFQDERRFFLLAFVVRKIDSQGRETLFFAMLCKVLLAQE